MLYNFLAAFTVYYLLCNNRKNIEDYITNVMEAYKNPKRRIEEYKLINDNVIVDDYAHHPTEINSTYNALMHKYNNYEITIVFQPHTYSRTIYLNEQFKKVFEGKKAYIMDTFTAREIYDSQKEKVINEIFYKIPKYDINIIAKIAKKKTKQLIIFMGAGNINNEVKKILKLIDFNN